MGVFILANGREKKCRDASSIAQERLSQRDKVMRLQSTTRLAIRDVRDLPGQAPVRSRFGTLSIEEC